MTILTDANDILIDFDGNKAYLTDDELYVHDASDTNIVGGSLETNDSDLGEPLLDKLINYIELDYKGKVDIEIYLDKVFLTTLTTTVSSFVRKTQCLYLLMDYRKPAQKIKLAFLTDNPNTIIYNIEVDFSVMPRRKNNNVV